VAGGHAQRGPKGYIPATVFRFAAKSGHHPDIASNIRRPKASRAVGAAIGKNPISFVVPCHRALGKGGTLTGYHWGITRKQAMLGWEAGQVAA
jgi:O-6-methylguanine DNA methyltransferase